jgi:hypothetical protein
MQKRKHVTDHKLVYAANKLLAMMEESGGIADFMQKLLDDPEKYAEKIASAVHVAIAEYECDHL